MSHKEAVPMLKVFAQLTSYWLAICCKVPPLRRSAAFVLGRRASSNVGKFPAWQNYEKAHKERNIISQAPWSGWLARVAALEDNELLVWYQRLSRKA